ncbi:P-loop containing nucleoside triphosphate hydrolase protein [Russula earlei]|uniref:P-loop containing nucleoside triphosphate hydrolase protein n=1 Tax=Russula earlei TaxID=71964 RepID=A0ACC0TZK2_9AGAM|nr:P-loop containing nucleoside triphosphate hydrolase protein [Russula earlei]
MTRHENARDRMMPQARSHSQAQSQELINVMLLLIRNSSMGKSSLKLRFSDKQWLPEDKASVTIGIDFRDTAGQERFCTITLLYYRAAQGVILVYNVSSHEVFEALPLWPEEIENYVPPEVIKVVPPLPSVPQRLIKDELVELPSDPQTRPLPAEQGEDDEIHGYETDTGVHMRKHKSITGRKTKAERRRAGCRRITAYWLADGFRMKLLANFLNARRADHLSQMYHLPLLPGYGPVAPRCPLHRTRDMLKVHV